jgi:hypothetical protein
VALLSPLLPTFSAPLMMAVKRQLEVAAFAVLIGVAAVSVMVVFVVAGTPMRCQAPVSKPPFRGRWPIGLMSGSGDRRW